MLFRISLAERGALGDVQWGWSWAAYRQLFEPVYAKVFLSTLGFAFANAALCLVIAFPLAFAMTRLRPSLRIWAMALLLIPFWTSFLVRTLALMTVFRWEPWGWRGLYESDGVLLAMVYNYVPFAVLPLYSSLEKIENSTLEAARDLGANSFQVFWKVILPLSKSGLQLAFLFVFVPSLGEFLIPEIIGGGRFFLLGNFLQNQFLTARNWPLGSAAVSILVAGTFALLMMKTWLRREPA